MNVMFSSTTQGSSSMGVKPDMFDWPKRMNSSLPSKALEVESMAPTSDDGASPSEVADAVGAVESSAVGEPGSLDTGDGRPSVSTGGGSLAGVSDDE